MKRADIWSYGGGTQSVAIACLIEQGKLPRPERAVISDTGREATETWEYTERYVQPMLDRIGLKIEVASHSLSTVDLYSEKGDLLIPAFTATGKLPTFCSTEWKSRVVSRYLRSCGYGPEAPVNLWIGISLDEMDRVKTSDCLWLQKAHPLIWDYPLRRSGCYAVVEAAGLPTPPKSSCWCCPHRRNQQWRRLRDVYPQDWEKACRLDEETRATDLANGKSGVYLHDSCVPLREADIQDHNNGQVEMFPEKIDGCGSGMCWV